MDPQQMMKEGRAMLIAELGLQNMAEEDRQIILDEIGSVLFERVMLKLISLLPEVERDVFGQHFANQNIDEMQALIQKHIPDSQAVIKSELRQGIEEHKRLVAEEVAKA